MRYFILIMLFSIAGQAAKKPDCRSLFFSASDIRKYSAAQTVNKIINSVRQIKDKRVLREKIKNLLLEDPFLKSMINLRDATLITGLILEFIARDMGAELESDTLGATARHGWFKYEIEAIIIDVIDMN